MVIGSIAGASNIGSRSYTTKIVGKDEIGKIMSFMTALNTMAGIISTTISVQIFKATIDSYPGTVFQFVAFLCLLPVFIMMWIDFNRIEPEEENPEEKPKVDSSELNNNNNQVHCEISQL